MPRFIFLQNFYVFHEIDIALLGNGHFATAHMQRGILEDIEVASESHIVLVVGQEMQMDATVALNSQCVLDVIAIEPDTLFRYRRNKGVLQQTDMILIQIDIGEHILEHIIDDITRLEDIVDTLGRLSHSRGESAFRLRCLFLPVPPAKGAS